MPIKIKQHDETDCGAACLASICSHYNFELPISRIRQLASTDKKGTNILGLLEAAQSIGFEAKGVRGQFDSLFKIPRPAIAHIITKEDLHHYVVIYEVNKKFIKIMDPATGKYIKKSHRSFQNEWSGVLVLLLPIEKFPFGTERLSNYRRFWFLLKPHKIILIQALVGAIIYTLMGLSMSIYIQKITDHVLVNKNLKLLNLLGFIMVAILILQILFRFFKDVFTIKTGQQIDARLILGYYKHLLKLPQQFFDGMQVGEIISRINDAVKIRLFINETSLSITVNFFIVLFSFLLMFSYYWKLGLIMAAIIPIYIAVYWITNYLNKKTERKVMESAAELESHLVESIQAVGTIKRFGIEDHANHNTEIRFINLLNLTYTSALNGLFSGITSETISKSFTIIILWIGSYYVVNQIITPGELISFYAIIGYFTGPVTSLINSNKSIQNALIASDRLFEIMDLEREEEEDKFILSPNKIGDINFKNVRFRYGTRVEVFENFNLTIKKGQTTAIIGESGSGKSTLASLLQNIYPLQSGSISIGAMNLKYIENSSLRDLIGAVPQKIDLFNGNIIDNVALGEVQPDMERIIEICKNIGIINFIESLPNGFNTPLGENGASLSGGQKQRLAIARALYKRPEIVILDEATSSLDTLSESYVHRTLKKLKEQNKTIILIAHRLSSIVHADTIVLLDQGEILEMGSHDELYKKKGRYYLFWNKQMPTNQNKIETKTSLSSPKQ